MSDSCRSCGEPLAGPYCSACGQKRVRRLTFRGIVSEAAGTIASLDSKLLRTFFGLCRDPGKLAREYVEGSRKVYVNPIKYTFFTTTFFLLMIKVLEIPVWRLAGGNREGFMLIFGLLSYLVFFNVLGPAAVQRLIFRKRETNLVECYVMVLYCWGQLMLFFFVASLFGAYDSFRSYLSILAGGVAYLTWALIGFYGVSVYRAAPASIVVVFAYYFVAAINGQLVGWIVTGRPPSP